MKWEQFKPVSLNVLTEARKQIHQATQLPAIAGRCLNPKDSADSFAALIWDNELKALSSQFLDGGMSRTALRISDFELLIVEKKNEVSSSFKLNGKTYEEAFKWMSERINNLGFEPSRLNKTLPYEIPEYSTAKGGLFKLTDYSAFNEFQKYYSNAAIILEKIKSEFPFTSEIRCWPHHFDIATLITIKNDPDPEKVKTIGVGLSPGDNSYNEPYFYISPWPYPENKNDLPDLVNGASWHTENWFGVVLISTDILKMEENQEEVTFEAIKHAVNTCKDIFAR